MDSPVSRRFLVLVCIGAWAAGCPGGSDDPGDTVDPEQLTDFQRELLDAHNAVRAQATPVPSPALEPLAWSPHAEEVAREWAERCRFEHNPDRGHLGENLAATTPGAWTPPRVVTDWASEARDYDYANNRCAAGEVCGHYTQLVWRATTGVGCVVKTCTENSPFAPDFTTWQLWVCNYTPAGNVVGQKPY